MKKKLWFCLLIVLCMLPFFCLTGSSAEGQELKLSRYFTGTQGDWEIYGGNTSLIVVVHDPRSAEIAQSVDDGSLNWDLKVSDGRTYRVNPESYYLYGDHQAIILRFPTFAAGFCPAVNPILDINKDMGIYYDIDFTAYDISGKVVYYGSLHDVHSEITDPVVPEVGTLNGSRLDTGMRNYEGVTQLAFTIKESIVQKLYDERDKYTWRFSIAEGRDIRYMDMYPTSCVASSYLVTFEPCLAEEPFIPQKNVTYYINLELWEGDTLKYFAGSTIYGYTLQSDPILPGEKYEITFNVEGKTETTQWYKGQKPRYKGELVKPTDSPAYHYEFKGWQPEITKVTGNATYTAVFEQTITCYDITFELDEGESRMLSVPYGSVPVFTEEFGVKELSGGKYRLFVGWDKPLAAVTGNATYRALYEDIAADKALCLSMESGALYTATQRSFVYTLKNAAGVSSISFVIEYDKTRYELKAATPLLDGATIEEGIFRYEGSKLTGDTPLLAISLISAKDGKLGNSLLSAGDCHFASDVGAKGYLLEKGTVSLTEPKSGDITRDMQVNTADAARLLSLYVTGDKMPEDLADTNQDGVMDIRDAVRICSYLEKKTDKLWSTYDETKHTVTYNTQIGGKIVGSTTQVLTRTQLGKTVTATVSSKNYRFVGWSDGKPTERRQDIGIESDTTLTALFEEIKMTLHLPEVHIETDDGRAIASRDSYVNAYFSIKDAEKEEYNVTELPMQIRGRGNSSWDYFKSTKPSYRLKLDEKENLLGIGGAERDWILLTTYSDVSLMRQYMTWRVGDIFDHIPHSVNGRYVNVYLNDDFKGVYLLCERVEASTLGLEDEEDTLNKDYLLELDARASGEGMLGLDWFRVDGAPQPFVIKSQVDNAEQTEYIKRMTTAMSQALYSGDYQTIKVVVDIPSLVDFYIVEEFGKDRDVGFASVYLYKKASGVFYFTSPWDFDLGWGNDGAYPSSDGLLSTDGSGNPWFATLAKQDWFKTLVKNRMEELHLQVLAMGKEILATGEALYEAAQKDEELWNSIGRQMFLEPSSVYRLPDYESHCQYFYDWYMARWTWLCDYFGANVSE